MTTTRGRHATHGRRVLSARSTVLRAVAALVALPMVVTGLVTIAGPADAAGTVAPTLMAGSSFPLWYADTKGDLTPLTKAQVSWIIARHRCDLAGARENTLNIALRKRGEYAFLAPEVTE